MNKFLAIIFLFPCLVLAQTAQTPRSQENHVWALIFQPQPAFSQENLETLSRKLRSSNKDLWLFYKETYETRVERINANSSLVAIYEKNGWSAKDILKLHKENQQQLSTLLKEYQTKTQEILRLLEIISKDWETSKEVLSQSQSESVLSFLILSDIVLQIPQDLIQKILKNSETPSTIFDSSKALDLIVRLEDHLDLDWPPFDRDLEEQETFLLETLDSEE